MTYISRNPSFSIGERTAINGPDRPEGPKIEMLPLGVLEEYSECLKMMEEIRDRILWKMIQE